MRKLSKLQTATFAAGCFWCLDAIMRMTKGVVNVESGYSGGQTNHPTYDSVHAKETGHAESVQVTYHPDVIGYSTLLDIFWTSHNPTTLNQDGANVGTEYRSIIFYHDEEQKRAAEKSKREVATQLWEDPIVAEIVHFEKFWSAEDYHQNFFFQKPTHPYCLVVINPKLDKFKQRFGEYLRPEPLDTGETI